MDLLNEENVISTFFMACSLLVMKNRMIGWEDITIHNGWLQSKCWRNKHVQECSVSHCEVSGRRLFVGLRTAYLHALCLLIHHANPPSLSARPPSPRSIQVIGITTTYMCTYIHIDVMKFRTGSLCPRPALGEGQRSIRLSVGPSGKRLVGQRI